MITSKTFYVQFPYMLLCEKPIDEVAQYLELELENPGKLKMKFEVEKLFDQAAGELTCYWRTENVSAIMGHLTS